MTFNIDLTDFRSAERGSGINRDRPSSVLGISLYSVELDQPTFFLVDELGEMAGDSADESGVMLDTKDDLGDPPPKRRSIRLGFRSLRFDSRGGVGGLAGRVGNGNLAVDGSPMAAREV